MRDAADHKERTALQLAKSSASAEARRWAREYGTVLGRYLLNGGWPVHTSATCTLVLGRDVQSDQPVALKFMTDAVQFRREQEMRADSDAAGSGVLDPARIVPIYGPSCLTPRPALR